MEFTTTQGGTTMLIRTESRIHPKSGVTFEVDVHECADCKREVNLMPDPTRDSAKPIYCVSCGGKRLHSA